MAERIRLGLAGYGAIGRQHAAAARAVPGVDLVAVAEPSGAGPDGVPVHPDLGPMLDAGGLDGVILATPTAQHVDGALDCVDRGLPVLVEKPVGATADEARRLVETAEAAGVPVLVGHHRRHNPLIHAAKDAIARGAIGRVRAVQSTCWFYKPDPYFAAAPWRTKPGGGPIAQNLVHDIDLLRHLVGEIAAVQATLRPAVRGFEVEDIAAAVLEFADGAIGTVTVSDAVAAPWSWELTSGENRAYPDVPESCYLIGGSEGSLSVPDLRLWRHEDGPDWMTPIGATSLITGRAEPLVAQIANFADVIRGRAEPVAPGREGLKTIEVLEAIRASAAGGGRVAVG